MKRVLITGGSGFIGRNLAESYLRDAYELYVPNRGELDLSDEATVRAYLHAHEFDVIVHSAVKPSHRAAKDPTQILLANLRMFHNLARNEEHFGKMIVTGSGAIYDARCYSPRMPESFAEEQVPVDELGLYKYTVWKLIEGKKKYIDLRLFGVFGKYEDYSIRFISNMICKALFDIPLTMNQDRRFDYLWVEDFAPIVEHFIENDAPFEAYNVTTGKSELLSEIARMVLTLTGKDLPIIIKTEGFGREYTGDNARLAREMKGLSFTPIRAGIEKLIEYYKATIDRVDRATLTVDR